MIRRTGKSRNDSAESHTGAPFRKSPDERRDRTGNPARIHGKNHGKIQQSGNLRAASRKRIRANPVEQPHDSFHNGDVGIGKISGKRLFHSVAPHQKRIQIDRSPAGRLAMKKGIDVIGSAFE